MSCTKKSQSKTTTHKKLDSASYDVQWVRVERIWYYRHVLFDIINKIPIAELLIDNEDDETVENFIKNNIPSHKRMAIITDLKKSYDKIIDKLGFIHQKCTFHGTV